MRVGRKGEGGRRWRGGGRKTGAGQECKREGEAESLMEERRRRARGGQGEGRRDRGGQG
jgi:hypothetical protein